ncbi:hypothetical protein Cantr_02937 [Candida viswanathii]|uniref:Uncharacterized protein n=1 Tax=Candida viswanathii TaxID=5486 RepID=A0A367YNH4_9ASCO|nr:hypothetical protein Cantr_02937 [Candida viswanathii]
MAARQRYNRKSFSSRRPLYGAQQGYRPRPTARPQFRGRQGPPPPRRGGYRRYYHQQPSHYAYVEEPDSDAEPSDEDDADYDVDEDEYDDYEVDEDEYDDYEVEGPEEYYKDVEEPEVYYEDDDEETDDELPILFASDGNIDDDEIELTYVDSDGNEYPIDNEELEEAIMEKMEEEGQIHDLNDEIVAYYDDDVKAISSGSDSSSSSDSDSDSDSDSSSSSSSSSNSDSSSSDSDSDSDDEIIYIVNDQQDSSDELDTEEEQELKDKLLLEYIRQEFEDGLASGDEIDSEDESSELGSEPEYFEVDSEDDSNSDEEGITIYKTITLPEEVNDEDIVLYDNLDDEDDEDDEDYVGGDDKDTKLIAYNSDDDEFLVIDLTEDLENSLDYRLEEVDDSTYKLNVRFPSLVKDALKIDFLKNENELVISGKLNLHDADIDEDEAEEVEEEENDDDDEIDSDDPDASLIRGIKENAAARRERVAELLADLEERGEAEDSEDDEDYDQEAEEEEEEEEEDDDEEEEDDDEEDPDTSLIKELVAKKEAKSERVAQLLAELEAQEGDYNEESDEEWNGVEGEEDDDEESSSDEEEEELVEGCDCDCDCESSSDEDEEVQEDAEELAKQYKNEEVHFEKHFQFDKIIKFNEIQAKFIGDDELELIIPNENKTVDEENTVSIIVEPLNEDESSSNTEEIDAVVTPPTLEEVGAEDVVME